MPKLKLTKNELRRQKDALKRYERYRPTLQLKKQQLRQELERVRAEHREAQRRFDETMERFTHWIELWGEDIELDRWFGIRRVDVSWDNIAGVDVPVFNAVRFRLEPYDLFETPLWADRATEVLRELISREAELLVLAEQERLIAREWRLTAQRVNLFEQVKIPEARENLKRISVYLADQQTAAFGWSLMIKRKLNAATT